MAKKKKSVQKGKSLKITVADYLKAVKKADREVELSQSAGFQSTHKIHKNKKAYDRKENKRCIDSDE